ncbi:MAG: acetylxylan esterase [Bacteroidales bacterium]|nr:acetylxylan esterase [Bacteroidales bacterium]
MKKIIQLQIIGMVRKITFLLILLFVSQTIFSQDEELSVVGNMLKYEKAKSSLYNYYADLANVYLDEREKEIAKLSTEDDWLNRQKKVRKILDELIGPFPSKTPLNAQVTGTVQKEKYRVEKIIYESQPHFFVTGLLFIPNSLKQKTAAILFTSGHAQEAFRYEDYQRVCINLVEKGFVVFAIDPIGQGERIQNYNTEHNKSIVGESVFEHSYAGAQCLLVGSSIARYMIWDGIRAIDYLVSRKEVDATRIGITGHSGGGTQAAYIAAFDKRILAVASECYITNIRRLWENVGPQDAEQNLFKGVASGIDLADLLEIRAPKPALQITTTRDFFPIQGAIETENEVKRIYRAFNKEENFARVEDDAPHAVTLKNREARNAFFQKFLNVPGDSRENRIELLSADDMKITSTGQVTTSLGGETVYSLNKKEAQNYSSKLQESRNNLSVHLLQSVESAKQISGYTDPEDVVEAVFTGRFQKDGYVIKKYYIEGDGKYPIPFLLFLPDEVSGAPVIYLDPLGKDKQAESGGEIEQIALEGHPVFAPDLLGFGEMGPNLTLWGSFDSNLGDISFKHWFAPAQLGLSQVGLHAADINRLVRYIQQLRFHTKKIIGIAKGDYCPDLIHAAAFNKAFEQVALIDPLVSYSSIVTNQYYHADFLPPFVYGGLTAYDLPDLEASLAPRKLLLINTKNQLKKEVTDTDLEEDFSIINSSYKKENALNNLSILKVNTKEKESEKLMDWLK